MLIVLDKNLNSKAALQKGGTCDRSYYNDTLHKRLKNDLNTLTFQIIATPDNENLIEKEDFIVYNDDGKNLLLVVLETKDSHSNEPIRTIYCESSAIRDLGSIVVGPQSFTATNISIIINTIVNGSGWAVEKVETDDLIDFEITEHQTALKTVNDLMELSKGEFEFTVGFSVNKPVTRRINILNKRGIDHRKILEYANTVTEIERTEHTKELKTAIIGIGKDGLTFDGFLYTDPDEKFRLTGNYVENIPAFQTFNINGRHRFGVFKDDNITSPAALYEKTKEHLKEVSKPHLEYNVKIIDLARIMELENELIDIGDTVYIKDFEYNPPFLVEARVHEIKKSKTNPADNEIVLGNFKEHKPAIVAEIEKIKEIVVEKGRAQDAKIDGLGENINGLGETVGSLQEAVDGLDGSVGGVVENVDELTTVVNNKEGIIYKQSVAPAHAPGLLWLNTSVVPNILYRSTGSAWVKSTPTKAAEITATSTLINGTLQQVLTTHETSIKQTAQEIELKVTEDDVHSILRMLPSNVIIKAANIDLDGITRVASNVMIGYKSSGGTLSFEDSTGGISTVIVGSNIGFGINLTGSNKNFGIHCASSAFNFNLGDGGGITTIKGNELLFDWYVKFNKTPSINLAVGGNQKVVTEYDAIRAYYAANKVFLDYDAGTKRITVRNAAGTSQGYLVVN